MTPDPQDLIEQVVCAWRERDASGRVRSHPAWHDLDENERQSAHQSSITMRQLEAALDPDGWSTTTRAVVARILTRNG